MIDAEHILLIAAVFLVAGLVKGVIGLGLPTVAIGLLGLAMPPAQAAAILVFPSLLTNVWQAFAGPYLWTLLRRLGPMLLAIPFGAWAGAGVLTAEASSRASMGLGAALALYGILGLSAVKLAVPRRAETFLGVPVGLATGFMAGATGIFVIPSVPYVQALEMERDELLQALGLTFMVSTLALAGALLHGNAFTGALAGQSVLALAPAFAGMWLGQQVRARVSPAVFRRCFFVGALAVGAHLLLRGFF